MKNIIKIMSLTLFLCVNSQRVTSQEASSKTKNLQAVLSNEANFIENKIKETVLSEGEYTFDNGKNNILVEINEGYYTEHYANNEFIKAKLKWISKYEYNLIITEIHKKGLPFVAGTILNTKIFKVKGNRYYYESNLEGLSWTGKFIKK
jgi:hypothetical protein